jgi:NAD+ synthase (glutamine-hydrolysing)
VTHGYTSQDWFQDRDIINASLEPLEKIIPATRRNYGDRRDDSPEHGNDGRRLFNSAAVIHDGELLGFADKTLLPEYDVFDDPALFRAVAGAENVQRRRAQNRRRRVRRFLER